MRKFFKAKLKYQKEDDEGRLAVVVEDYLVDAVSYTEAEALMYQFAGETVRGEFTITSLTKTNLTDVFDFTDGASPYWQAKVQYYVTDADSGTEKQVTNNMLVDANTPDEALSRIRESLSNLLVSFEINALTRTKILEIILPEAKDSEEDDSSTGTEQEGSSVRYSLAGPEEDERDDAVDTRDALFEDAARLVVTHQQGSTSLLQRKMKLGYNRAGRIMKQLEAAGIVDESDGITNREVLIEDETSLEKKLQELRTTQQE